MESSRVPAPTQTSAGFQYLADEQDPVALRYVSSPAVRGNLDSVVAYARRYPHAFTFIADQELVMLADVTSASRGRGNAVWGCDQSFGATHALDRLLALPGPGPARAAAIALRTRAEAIERLRDLDHSHFMSRESKSDELARLVALYAPPPGSESDFLLQSLVVSDRIYRNYREQHYYDNGLEREEYMKRRFMDEYRRAETADGAPPKVLLKLGHWHLYRGLGPSNLQTLGDFVSQLAVANDNGSFHLAIWPNGDAGEYGDLHGWSVHGPLLLSSAASPSEWTLLDLRPLRASWRQVSQSVPVDDRDDLRRWVFGFDAALFIGRMHPGTHHLVPGIAY
jgi:hypothetical protein